MQVKSKEIQKFILNHLEPFNTAKLTAEHFGISRQATNKHIKNLINAGLITEEGNTKSKIYRLATQTKWGKKYKITSHLAEDVIWREEVMPLLSNLADNQDTIWHYGFTEMFNNAIDHSEGNEIQIQVLKNAINTEIIISDNGVGIFNKIQKALHLIDEQHALLELSKGKLTTDSTRHTGEGIFFTSRVFDNFEIESGGLRYSCQALPTKKISTHNLKVKPGTQISLQLHHDSKRKIKTIFDKFAPADEYSFNKTEVPVQLVQYDNDKLISRSQAKRLLTRFEQFKIVTLDFKNVPSIGQAFADEIFRVFVSQHPQIEIKVINAKPLVAQMIKRAESNK